MQTQPSQQTPSANDSRTRLALAAIVAAGALLRFFRLEHQSFWYDETVSARFTTYPIWDVLVGREFDLGNPPLHYGLLNAWARLFGTSDAALRSLSAVASVAAIPLLYSIARRLTDARVGLVAAALLAIAPAHVYLAQETRTYAVTMTLALLSIELLQRLEQAPNRIYLWAAYALTLFLCPYGHYFAFFFLAGHLLYVLAVHRKDRGFLARWALAVVAAATLFSVMWMPAFLAQLTTEGNLSRSERAWHLHVLTTPMVFSVGTTLVWKDTASWPRIAAAIAALAAFGTAFVAGLASLRANRRALTLLLCWLLSPTLLPLVISLLLSPLYNVRYVMIASPAMLVLVAAGLVRLSRTPRIAAGVGIVATCAASLVLYYTTTVKHDWRSAAAWLDQRLQPGDLIVFDVDTGEAPFARYSRGGATHLRLLPPKTADGQPGLFGTPNRLDPPHDVAPVVRAAPRIWFVLSDPGDGSGDYYRDLFKQRFKASDEKQFRGIEITLYENPPHR